MSYSRPLSAEDSQRLQDLYQRLSGLQSSFVGYPCNQDFDYSELYPFLSFIMNNVGDPYADSNFRINTHDIEREVLDDIAALLHADMSDHWGYITSGGTEGNMYGLYLGRELYPEGIVYYSEDTHYSVAKILRVLHTRSIMIKSSDNGEMDYEDLHETLKIHRDSPPIMFANIGTTMTGAIDQVSMLTEIMNDLAIPAHYIHCDAALSGFILPFVDDPPSFDFASGIDSISVSGHKLLGSPVPYGIVLARTRHVERIARSVEYVGVLDTTIGGSRNAFSPLILWYALRRYGQDGLRQLVARCLTLADYAIETFKQYGIEAWRHKHSITVVFPRPSANILQRWQIAPCRNISHIITLPHVNEDMINQLAGEIAADREAAT